ncbi:hypothetical protein Tb10.70.3060 [Trypanosoma brucei brucei TREU927]|uniref:T. brucei spp.-specific protein n=1 Tax=Trypanosoma brucei brucei (strain 927/4 GUTat10.1) TaxID=185431 RepID=Q38BI1_TRYB2|nr:hypothetical protein Tb10.70.3060 [Trypanosoma brucei brucei TREU927]EAN77839.1 hypothetical protein Tb10.70.3060 [Trypanosoma brucei brucei TREU927]
MRENGGVLHRCVGTKGHGACSVTEATETTPERYGVLPRFPPLFFHIKTPVAETPAGPRSQKSLPFLLGTKHKETVSGVKFRSTESEMSGKKRTHRSPTVV